MKFFFQKTISLLMAASLALTLTGCGLTLSQEERLELREEEPEVIVGQSIGQELAPTYAADQIFSLNSVSDASYNPYITSSAWNKVVGMLVYESMVELDESFEAHPNLIAAWETEDGVSWTFTVDTSRSFHDGGAMTALDAMYTLEFAMNYDLSPFRTRFRHVTSVYSLDSERFVVTLNQADMRFYTLLDIPCIEYGSGYSDRPPGTGPYMFSKSGRYLTLNSAYPRSADMPLDTIHLKEYSAAVDILQAFEDSYLDLVINDPNGMSSLGYSSTNITKYVNTSSLHYLGYNASSVILGQSIYRLLMTYAIDRNAIVSEIMAGAAVAASVPVSPQSELYPSALAQELAYSPSALETALQSVGAQDLDGDGTLELGGMKYTIDFIVCSDSAVKVAVARSITKALQDAGFDVNLRELGYEDYLEALEKGKYDIYYAEVRLCADWDLTLLLGSGQSLNYGGVRDSQMDSLLAQFLASPEESLPAAAQALYEHIGRNGYITPICFERSEVLYHRGVLSGLSPTQDNIFYGMENWTIDIG